MLLNFSELGFLPSKVLEDDCNPGGLFVPFLICVPRVHRIFIDEENWEKIKNGVSSKNIN